MSDFKAKMHPIRFRLGLRPRPLEATCKKVIWGAPASFPSLSPLPFPLPSFSLLLEVGPLIAARESGGALPQRSPAAKRYLVNLRQKYSFK